MIYFLSGFAIGILTVFLVPEAAPLLLYAAGASGAWVAVEALRAFGRWALHGDY